MKNRFLFQSDNVKEFNCSKSSNSFIERLIFQLLNYFNAAAILLKP